LLALYSRNSNFSRLSSITTISRFSCLPKIAYISDFASNTKGSLRPQFSYITIAARVALFASCSSFSRFTGRSN